MYGISAVDEGCQIDWGLTSADYAKYRQGPPDRFYEKLLALDIGLKNQKILDLATGTGVLARKFAEQGAISSGVDISTNQIEQAKKLAVNNNLKIDFRVSSAESTPFDDQSFDVITANQCWLYFDEKKIISEMRRLLAPNGLLMISYFSWSPRTSKIAAASEALILKYNPAWSGHDYRGYFPPMPEWAQKDFDLKAMFYNDEEIQFTREIWMGRIRASRGIGAALSTEKVGQFDLEHEELLRNMAPEEFTIPHRMGAHVLVFKD